MRKQQKRTVKRALPVLQVVRAPRSVAMQAGLTVIPALRCTAKYTLQHEA